MLRLFAGISLMLLVAALPVATAEPSGQVSCTYLSDGVSGVLGIGNAAGRPYFAVDTLGALVSSGCATSANFVVAVIGAAPGPLLVRVGDEVLLAASPDRSSDWQ